MMKKWIFLLGIHLLLTTARAQSPEQYSQVRIDLRGHTIGELATLGIETDHGLYEPGRSLTTVLETAELLLVRQAGFVAEVLIPDLNQWYRERKNESFASPRGNVCDDGNPAIGDWQTPANYKAGSMGGYPTYTEMLAALDEMRSQFPHLISARAVLSDTILTHEGRPVWWVKISDQPDQDEAEPEMLYTALHHAREPNSLSQMLFYMWYLLENYAQNTEIQYLLNNTELYFIPCLNPDGYVYNGQTNPQGGGLWRKNRRNNGNGTFGVDLNRNYGYQWGINDQGSSPNPSSQSYRGPAPFSEPETRMIRDFCLTHDFKYALNYHTQGNLFIYPWAYSDQQADPVFEKLARLFTRENKYRAGITLETVGYRVNGSSDDWMYGASDIFSFTPEVGPNQYNFWPPADTIIGLNKANMWQNLAPAFSLLRFGVVEEIRAGAGIDLSNPKIHFRLTRFGFEDGPLTVSLLPVSPNITGAGAPLSFNLSQFAAADSAFALNFSATVKTGDTAVFVLALNNGSFSRQDTLRKVLLGPAIPIFTENGNQPLANQWASSNAWGSTTATYFSAPASIADSPDGDYAANALNSLRTTAPVSIPAGAKTAQLRFMARWAIEKNRDYVRVMAESPDLGLQSLCGRFTRPGTGFQVLDEPVFDGVQNEWVEECMDLSAFIGKQVFLQFDLGSDGFQQFDGFYFDDLRIEYTAKDFVGVVSLDGLPFSLLQNQPNPARDYTLITWEKTDLPAPVARLLVFNMLGELVAEHPVDLTQQSEFRLDTRTLAPGSYWYCLQTENRQSRPRKMSVVRP